MISFYIKFHMKDNIVNEYFKRHLGKVEHQTKEIIIFVFHNRINECYSDETDDILNEDIYEEDFEGYSFEEIPDNAKCFLFIGDYEEKTDQFDSLAFNVVSIPCDVGKKIATALINPLFSDVDT